MSSSVINQVLVTGATGFVGREVVRQLHAEGLRTHAVVRDPESPDARFLADHFSAALHRGDILDIPSLEACMPAVDAVVHLVGIIGEIGPRTFDRVHSEGTRNVVSVARKWGVKRIVHMSALGTRLAARSRYHQTKWAGEEAVRQSGLRFTIFRPSLIFGPRDGFVNLVARLIRFSPVLAVMGDGEGKAQPVDVDSVATAFARAVREPRSEGETYDLCGPETLSYREIFQGILAATGWRRWILHVPMPIARLQARIMETVFPMLFGKPSPLTRDQLLMLGEDNVGDGERAIRLFDLEPLRFGDGTRRYLRPAGSENSLQQSDPPDAQGGQ